MASQETPNYRLSRWAGTDRILVEEFNDNWDKIDAALGAQNCQLYTTTYTGQGSGVKQTLTFPHKPMAVFIMRSTYEAFFILVVGFRGSLSLLCVTTGNGNHATAVEWGERSIT